VSGQGWIQFSCPTKRSIPGEWRGTTAAAYNNKYIDVAFDDLSTSSHLFESAYNAMSETVQSWFSTITSFARSYIPQAFTTVTKSASENDSTPNDAPSSCTPEEYYSSGAGDIGSTIVSQTDRGDVLGAAREESQATRANLTSRHKNMNRNTFTNNPTSSRQGTKSPGLMGKLKARWSKMRSHSHRNSSGADGRCVRYSRR
jgi:hypothetical protein